MNLESSLPLKGKTVVITRSQDQQAEARSLFEGRGARVLDLPALVIVPPDEWRFLDDSLQEINRFHWIIFSSSNGVMAVEKRLQLIGTSLALLSKSLKIAAVGRKTARLLESLDAIPDFVPPEFVADSLINNFPVSVLGLRFLIPRVQTGGRNLLAKELATAGAHVVEVPAYESKCPTEIPRNTLLELTNTKVDAVLFTSAKTAAHTAHLLKEALGIDWQRILFGVKIISIGPQTSLSCRKYFNRVDQEANQHDLEGLLEVCIQSIQS